MLHFYVRLLPNTIVCGRYGPLAYANPTSKRKSATSIVGKVLHSIGQHMYLVRFENGQDIECKSCKLKVVPKDKIPPSMRPSSDVTESSSTSSSCHYAADSDIDDIIPNETNSAEEEEDNNEEENQVHEEEIVLNSEPDTNNDPQDNVTDEAVQPPRTYHEKLRDAKARILDLTGDNVTTKSGRDSMLWTVVEQHVAEATERDDTYLGLKPEILNEILADPQMAASSIFLRLMYGTETFVPTVVKLNRAIQIRNDVEPNRRQIKMFSNKEFLVAMAQFIGSVCFSANGKALWKQETEEDNGWVTIEPSANFGKYLPLYRFKEWRRFLPITSEDPTRSNSDPWWRFAGNIEFFNLNRLRCIASSNHVCIDELMSAWRPRKTKTGGLPNLTYVSRKPEPLGSEFKVASCSRSKVMLHLEIQRGAEGMKNSRYQRQLGAMAACTVRLADEW